MARTPVATDAFAGYPAGSFPNANWSNLDGNNGEVRVVTAGGSVGSEHSGYSTMRRSAGTYSTEQYAKATILGLTGSNTSNQVGVTCRNSADASPGQDCYAFYYDDGQQSGTKTLRLERMVNDARSSLATATTGLPSAGGTISMEVTGTGATVTINCYVDDVIHASFTNIADTNAARIVAAGRPGVLCQCGGTGFALSLDDWEGGDLDAVASPYVLPFNFQRTNTLMRM